MGVDAGTTAQMKMYGASRVSPIELSILGVFALISSFAVLFLCFQQASGIGLTSRDYIAYWATGKQLLHHGNPYDAGAILSIEETAGYFATNQPLLMRNPPTALFVALPLGLAGARTGWLLWVLILIGCLAIAARSLWILHQRPPNHIHYLTFFLRVA